MNKQDYIQIVIKALNAEADFIKGKFENVLNNPPPKATGIDVFTFTDQDGEGVLDIRISMVGPEVYVLNKQIGDNAVLFDSTASGLPMLDPFDLEFDACDTLVDLAAQWLKEELAKLDLSQTTLPIRILNPDGYGTCGITTLKK
jgi:hypothetical protein